MHTRVTTFASVRLAGLVLALMLVALFTPLSASAGQPTFPWSSHKSGAPSSDLPTYGSVPVRVLSQPALTPVEVQSPKQAYPYGFFGSQPNHHWKRSFGVSRAYTQWSRM